MTDRDALLAAIRRDRDEDVPRLMYADEIEATEPKRAELIRVQVELAKVPPCEWRTLRVCNRSDRLRCVPCGERFALQDREFGLFNDPHPVGNYRVYSNRLGWTEDVRQWAHDIEWGRGFVRKFVCKWKDWANNAAAILPEHPGLERVTLTTSPRCSTTNRSPDGGFTTDWQLDEFPGEYHYVHATTANEVATQLIAFRWAGDPKDGGWGVAFDLPRPDAHGGQYRH